MTLRDLASPILRRKGTWSVTFLVVVSVTLLLGHLRFQKYQPESVIKTQASQSLNQADLDREAKLDAQNYLRVLSAKEQGKAERPLVSKKAVFALFAIVLGLLTSVAVAYFVDYRDPCFHSPVQVIRTLGIPLVVAIPKKTV